MRCLHLVRLASCKTLSCSSSTYRGFEIWVLRFRALGASFARSGCFVLGSLFLSASFSKLPVFNNQKCKMSLFWSLQIILNTI